MKQRLALLTVATAFAVTTVFAQDPKPIPLNETVDTLVAKNVEAKGGAPALKALQSLKLSGKMIMNSGQLSLAFAQTKKRPGAIRNEVTLQGMTAVQAFDGVQGWKIYPFQGRKDPEKLSADDSKELVEAADVEGPLVDWKAKGNTVEYLGTEDVDGTMAHKLKVVRKNGDVTYVFLDPDHFLEIRTIDQRVEKGAQVEVETDLGEYEKIGGVYVPFAIESGPKGAADKEKIVIEKAEPNTPIDDNTFHFPAPVAK